jgi:pyrimidine deaminase RibD-like protein
MTKVSELACCAQFTASANSAAPAPTVAAVVVAHVGSTVGEESSADAGVCDQRALRRQQRRQQAS